MKTGTSKRKDSARVAPATGDVGSTSRLAGRPRSDAARGAILEAAYAILLENDLGTFSIEAVAVRAGVARTTIYRWWPTKGRLAIESFFEAFKPKLAYGRSGAPDDNFRVLLKSLADTLSGPDGQVAVSVLMHAQGDAETLSMFREQFSEPLRAQTAALLQAGIDQGRFRRDLDIPLVIDAAVGAVYLRLLFGLALDSIWAHSLADTLLVGCHAAASR